VRHLCLWCVILNKVKDLMLMSSNIQLQEALDPSMLAGEVIV